jgi:hypothetical protein
MGKYRLWSVYLHELCRYIHYAILGAHRTLGPSVSRVRSTKLDSWVQDNIDIMEAIGNAVANSYFEF